MDPPPPRREHVARKCDTCGLRFPVALPAGGVPAFACPRCQAPTRRVDDPYVSHGPPAAAGAPLADTPLVLEVLLDNVRSLRNVGSMFRSADGAGVSHLHLGGITPTPAHPRLAKTALGAERAIAWTAYPDAAAAAAELASSGRTLWAIEGGPRATSLFDPGLAVPPPSSPLVVVFGHEVSGIDPRIVASCERVIFVPMLGYKDSLNVSVALGIVAYTLRFRAP